MDKKFMMMMMKIYMTMAQEAMMVLVKYSLVSILFVCLFAWRKESWYIVIRDFVSCQQGLALMVTHPSRSILGAEQTFLLR